MCFCAGQRGIDLRITTKPWVIVLTRSHISKSYRTGGTAAPCADSGFVQFDTTDWAAFGVMGEFMQPQCHLQVLTNILDRKMSLQAARDQPRWRYISDEPVKTEPQYDSQVVSKLARCGHDIGIGLPVRRWWSDSLISLWCRLSNN